MPRKDYGQIDDAEKKLKDKTGLFYFPNDVVGKTDHGLRKFLIFYFDDEKDYEVVLAKLSKPNPHVKSHPDMNSKALADLVRNEGK